MQECAVRQTLRNVVGNRVNVGWPQPLCSLLYSQLRKHVNDGRMAFAGPLWRARAATLASSRMSRPIAQTLTGPAVSDVGIKTSVLRMRNLTSIVRGR